MKRSSNSPQTAVWPWLIGTLYLLITLAYGVINPLFEAPDEHWHVYTAVYIAENGRLPFVADGDTYDTFLSQEAAQPPLYYLLGSLIIRPIDLSDAREALWLNPFARIGDAGAVDNLNNAIQTSDTRWPWRGVGLAAHLLRLFSTLLGLGTVLLVYQTARLLWPHHPHRAPLAMALVAFLPQFNFIHAAASNDTLITFLCAAGVYQALWLWQHTISTRRLLLLGITVGLAALSKNAGILLAIFVVGTLGLLAWRLWSSEQRPFARRLVWQTAVFVILPLLLIAGWLWVRNFQLYGDPLATEPFIRIAGGDRGYTLWQVLGESSGLWLSLFGVFGWFNLRPPAWIYTIWNSIIAVSVALAAWAALRRSRDSRPADETLSATHFRLPIAPLPNVVIITPALLLFGWFLAVYAGLVTFMMQTEAAQGRLLFPAIVPLGLGVAFGLSQTRLTAVLAPLLALATTLLCLLGVIRPAYALPATVAALPETAVRLDAPLGQGLTLVGAALGTELAQLDDLIPVTLTWRLDERPADPPEFKFELLGRNREDPLGELHSYHGRGQYPATEWPLEQLLVDSFTVRLDGEGALPVLAEAFVRLVDDPDFPEGVRVGEIKLVPDEWPVAPEATLAVIGEQVALKAVTLSETAVSPGDTVTILITWEVLAAPNRDLTTLVHLAESDQPPLATGDSPPLNGRYPTHVWAPGEVIEDRYTLTIPADLPPGNYPLWIGLYDSETIVPLPVMRDGEVLPNGRFPIGTLAVE